MNRPEKYSYWKKPWHKWAAFGATVLQAIALYLRIQEFQDISRVEIRSLLFSPSAWESYVTEQYFQGSLSIFILCLFLGCFLIGLFARSKKTADILTGILLIVLSLFWGMIGFAIPVFSRNSMIMIWALLFLASLGGGIHAIWVCQRQCTY